MILTSTIAARADWVSGYTRRDGTSVMPYYRTPANGIPYDNLSYRGYASQQPTYLWPRAYSYDGSCSAPATITGTSTQFGNTTFHNYQSSSGSSFSGTTTRFGNTSFTTILGR